MRAIEDGNYNPTLTKRLTALEADKVKAEAEVASTAAPTKLRIHPNLPALYRRKVEQLEEALTEPATQVEAGEIIRSLIDRIELTPTDDTLAIKLYGDLAQIIAFSEAGKQKDPPRARRGQYRRWLRGHATALICSYWQIACHRYCRLSGSRKLIRNQQVRSSNPRFGTRISTPPPCHFDPGVHAASRLPSSRTGS